MYQKLNKTEVAAGRSSVMECRNHSQKVSMNQLIGKEVKSMKKLTTLLLLLAIFCMSSCQQKKAEIRDNCVYWGEEKILEGTDEMEYTECIFMEKQNAIVILDSQGNIKGNSIYTYDIKTKETKQIVSGNDFGGPLSGLLKGSDDSFYFEFEDCEGGSSIYKYQFSTQEVVHISFGAILDIIKKGKYKGCLIVYRYSETDSPCYTRFLSHWIVDENGKEQGCLDYTFESFKENREYDFANIQFVEPPHCDFAEKLELWHGLATEGLKYIQQYLEGNTSVESKIEQIKIECDEYQEKYNDIILSASVNDDLLSQQQKEKSDLVMHFNWEYANYKLPFVVEVKEHEFGHAGKFGYVYNFNATVVNRSKKQITKAQTKIKTGTKRENSLFGVYDVDVYDNPKVEIVFKDKTISATADVGFFAAFAVFAVEDEDLGSVSIEKPWKQREQRRIKTYFTFEDLNAIHFEYTPKSCTISIPFVVEDPTGYTYTTYFKYDISDDWKQFAESLKK